MGAGETVQLRDALGVSHRYRVLGIVQLMLNERGDIVSVQLGEGVHWGVNNVEVEGGVCKQVFQAVGMRQGVVPAHPQHWYGGNLIICQDGGDIQVTAKGRSMQLHLKEGDFNYN